MKSYIFIQENLKMSPDSKVHGANMGPIWGRHDPGGPHELCYLGRQEDGCHFVLASVCEHSKAKWRIHTSLVYVIIYLDNSV